MVEGGNLGGKINTGKGKPGRAFWSGGLKKGLGGYSLGRTWTIRAEKSAKQKAKRHRKRPDRSSVRRGRLCSVFLKGKK